MGKIIIWVCDQCQRQEESEKLGILPRSWLEVSFYDYRVAKFRRFCFCGNKCLSLWSETNHESYTRRRAENEQNIAIGELDD